MLALSKDVLTSRSANATAAGTTAINGATLDMQGFAGARAIAALGTLTATQVTGLKAQVGNLANASDMTDLSGAATSAAADGDSNKLLILDVLKPTGYRYLRFVVTRGTANAVLDALIVDQYLADKKPVTQGSTVSQTKTVVAATP